MHFIISLCLDKLLPKGFQIPIVDPPPLSPVRSTPILLHPILRNINLHNITHSLISRNSRERMFVVQISLLIVTFLSPNISNFVINANHQRSQPTPLHCAMCQYVECHFLIVILLLSSYATCWMLVHAYAALPGRVKWSGPHQRRWEENVIKFQSVTCYTNSTVSRIHVNTARLRNIICPLVAACVILRS